jgi:two-component system sensor histidine kinase KdpD
MSEINKTSEFIELLKSSKRGRLKVYIGSVAGVGKTYRMLQEAHTLKAKGIDVVLGYIETHKRDETENLLDGLEEVPRFQYRYKDIVVEEMDIDAILVRKPDVVIVDELAHTNLPVCRNDKRYKDVVELLVSGINVICAFNIQHLESLNDIVSRATNVKINETVPDSFLNKADQIVNIDLSAEDLIDRLKAGKIYKAEKINEALNNFFKIDNLSRLRELALREVAERLEKPLETVQETQGDSYNSTSDRMMVLLQAENFSQKYLLRKASRLAGKLNTDWFVVYVETPKDRPEVIDSQKQRFLYSDIQLVKELGGSFVHLKNNDRYKGWFDFADEYRIKHIVLPIEKMSWWNNLFHQSVVQKVVEQDKYDIHLVNFKNTERNIEERRA